MLAGLTPSIGGVGDALDNGLAETTIGLYKTECIREGSPFRTGPIRTLADLEDITSAWVGWFQLGQADAPARPTPARRGRGGMLRSDPGRTTHRPDIRKCAHETPDASIQTTHTLP